MPKDGLCCLKLARPSAIPALHYNFRLCIELDTVLALPVQVAKETFAPAAEWIECHWCGNAHIDPDIAGVRLCAELARSRTAARENARHVAIAACVHQLDCLVNIAGVHQA